MDVVRHFTKADMVITGGALSSPIWLNFTNIVGAILLTAGGLIVVYWKIREARAKALREEALALKAGGGEPG